MREITKGALAGLLTLSASCSEPAPQPQAQPTPTIDQSAPALQTIPQRKIPKDPRTATPITRYNPNGFQPVKWVMGLCHGGYAGTVTYDLLGLGKDRAPEYLRQRAQAITRLNDKLPDIVQTEFAKENARDLVSTGSQFSRAARAADQRVAAILQPEIKEALDAQTKFTPTGASFKMVNITLEQHPECN